MKIISLIFFLVSSSLWANSTHCMSKSMNWSEETYSGGVRPYPGMVIRTTQLQLFGQTVEVKEYKNQETVEESQDVQKSFKVDFLEHTKKMISQIKKDYEGTDTYTVVAAVTKYDGSFVYKNRKTLVAKLMCTYNWAIYP